MGNEFNLKLGSIERKLHRAIPRNLYTTFQSLRLRFVSTVEHPATNIAGYIWRSGDEHEIDYLSAIQMIEEQFPHNFIVVGKPKRAPFGIGRIVSPLPHFEVMAFHDCHQRVCGIWLELDTVARHIYPGGLPYKSEAYCSYTPENGMIIGRLATYKDLGHLLQATRDGIRIISDLKKQLKISNVPEIAPISQTNASDSQIVYNEEEPPNIFEHTSKVYRIRFAGSKISYFNELTGLNYISECIRLRPKAISAKDLLIGKYGKLLEVESHGNYIPGDSERSSEALKNELLKLNKRRHLAEEDGDENALQKIDDERLVLEEELKRYKKYGGKPKREFDINKKYKTSVGQSIRYAYKKLDSEQPELVSHLKKYLLIGKRLTYTDTIEWHI